ncbi:MAG TPA: ribbon-helix-helix domain-containing protein [Methyloceanibacter sp.]|nr:ribbon-helix-helix domain-containing protein [Methyloceanibacter sp.]
MPPSRKKRSLTIARHRTSVTVEEPFWDALGEIARAEGKSVAAIVGEIDRRRSATDREAVSLSAAIRLYVLERTKRRGL